MAKFIRFDKMDEYADRPVYAIVNKKSGIELGKIGYYPPWRQFVAKFGEGSIWSDGCLDDVAEAIARLKKGLAV